MRLKKLQEAHVLFFPFSLLGHVNCMRKLAELFSLADLHATFLNSHHNHRLFARNSGAYPRLVRRPTFRFLSIIGAYARLAVAGPGRITSYQVGKPLRGSSPRSPPRWWPRMAGLDLHHSRWAHELSDWLMARCVLRSHLASLMIKSSRTSPWPYLAASIIGV
ncbi:hypothetical protein Cni_G06283 [Canna indica]|uniref:Uncharacterized protein n=1 Tax=Canna indica TaxID=4628 RepID=A0AAQ3Q3W9_9LILI|nr:hypothetical protein Cni_G06283 [Canna indica]